MWWWSVVCVVSQVPQLNLSDVIGEKKKKNFSMRKKSGPPSCGTSEQPTCPTAGTASFARPKTNKRDKRLP